MKVYTLMILLTVMLILFGIFNIPHPNHGIPFPEYCKEKCRSTTAVMGRYSFDSTWSSTLGVEQMYMMNPMTQQYHAVAQSIEVDNIIWHQKRGIPF